MYYHMYRARRETVPIVPETFDEWTRLIYENLDRYGKVDGKEFFRTCLGEESNELLVFVNEDLSGLLRDAKYLHCDGTFKCLPRKPKSRQLFTIIAVAFNHVRLKIY